MGMFGNKDALTPEQLEETLAPLLKRMAEMEELLKKQAHRIAQIEQLMERGALVDTAQTALAADDYAVEGLSQGPAETSQQPTEYIVSGISSAQTLFLPAPTPDGQFTETSSTEQVGKSIYQLRTEDGINGQFIMLSSPDAIATAMISISQFVKPACRIEGNAHQQPRGVNTIEEGMAQNDGGIWKVVRKARVVFE